MLGGIRILQSRDGGMFRFIATCSSYSEPQAAKYKAVGEAVPGTKAVVRGTGDVGSADHRHSGTYGFQHQALNFKSKPDFAWRADMS